MFSGKQTDLLVQTVINARREIRNRVESEMSGLYEKEKMNGKYPWEMLWLPAKDIENLQKFLKTRKKIVLVETGLIFFFLALFSYALFILLRIFLLP